MRISILSFLCILALSLILCSCGREEGTAGSKPSADAQWMSDTGQVICSRCGGTGRCQACMGSGRTVAGDACAACDGSGYCSICNGEGHY